MYSIYAQTGSTYISGTMIDIVEISPLNLGFSTITSIKKALRNDCNDERQQEIAIWPSKPEVLISLELIYIASKFQRQIRSYNYDKFKKGISNDRDNDRLRYSITALFSITHSPCTCIYAMSLLRVWIRLHLYCAGKLYLNSHGWKPKICCWNFDAIYQGSRYTSALGGHIATSNCRSSSQLFEGTFFELVTVENPRFAVGISTISTLVPVLPVWTAILLLPISVVVAIIRGHFGWTRSNRKSYG